MAVRVEARGTEIKKGKLFQKLSVRGVRVWSYISTTVALLPPTPPVTNGAVCRPTSVYNLFT